MIKPVGPGQSPAIDAAKLRETTQTQQAQTSAVTAPVAATPAVASTTERVTTPAARLAREGAPVDMDKITRIKAAIASGNYPVDADAIADRMVELDLPRSLN